MRETGTERLCAVCVTKRAALVVGALPLRRAEGSFPSTSGVAAAPFKQALLLTGCGQAALEAHVKTIEQLRITERVKPDCLPGLASSASSSPLPPQTVNNMLTLDGDLFYRDTFTTNRLQKEYPGATATRAKEGADSLRSLFKTVREDVPDSPILPPSRYFAALMMDGDHMGAFFGQADDPTAQELSSQLANFATRTAKQIVEAHLGRLVYAGGDDAFALLPMEHALPCASELQAGFKQAVAQVRKLTGVLHPTPSIGIALAHHTAPLDGILLAMQRAEKDAKNIYGRDALCIHVLKRSGEEVRVGTKWSYSPSPLPQNGNMTMLKWEGDAAALMERGLRAFASQTLSMKFAGDVAREARGLSDSQLLPALARAAAIRRLAKRHSPDVLSQRQEALIIADALAAWSEVLAPAHPDRGGIEEVARWLLTARFIVSGGDEE